MEEKFWTKGIRRKSTSLYSKQKCNKEIHRELNVSKMCSHYDGMNCPCDYAKDILRLIHIAEKSFILIDSLSDDEKFVNNIKEQLHECSHFILRQESK